MSSPLQPLPSPSSAPAVLHAALSERYELKHYLGSGAEASVWHAIDRLDCTEVAIKHFPPRPGRRALQEFASLLPLRHPRIVPLRDFAYLPGGDIVIISAYIPGGSLRARLENDKALPPEQVFRIAEDMLSALGYLHSRGTLHRDIKPDNILVAPGYGDSPVTYQLADFGIAGSLHDAAPNNRVVGSPGYLAPEAYVRRVGPSADLYALGVTLHELLDGSRPFDGEAAELARAHLSTPPPRLSGPAAVLSPLVLALLEKDPDHRPANAASALALLSSLRPEVRPVSAPVAAPEIVVRLPARLAFTPASRLVLRSCFSLPAKVERFGLVAFGERPALVLNEGSHLSLHDAANGADMRISLPKTGGAHRIDGPGYILRANGRSIQLWDNTTRLNRAVAELPRICSGLAWHEGRRLLAAADDTHLLIENPGGHLPSVQARLPEGMRQPRLSWLAGSDLLAVAGGLLRPALRLHDASGELVKSLPLPGAVLEAPCHLGAPIWIVLDHGSSARLGAWVLDEGNTLRPLALPENALEVKVVPDGLLCLLPGGELRHLTADGRQNSPGALHPETRAFALSADERHLLSARPAANRTTFTLHAHQHA